MKFIASMILLFLTLTMANDDYAESWRNFKEKYGKTYNATEEKKRYLIFIDHLETVAKLNLANPLTEFGVNKFSDLTEKEFKVYHNSDAYYSSMDQNIKREPVPISSIADAVDWREKGAVTSVKDQSHCGSCWAFSAIGNIEGKWAIAGNKLIGLSEQELVSCSYTSDGCQGGLMDSAFKWLMADRKGTLMTEANYPYESGDGTSRPCKHLCRGLKEPATDIWCSQMCYDKQGKPLCTPELCDCSPMKNNSAATITGWEDLPKNEGQLRTWLSTNGPISIGVAVPLGRVWQGYTGGIMNNCGSEMTPDHGVLLVGYGSESGKEYWIVKNSWGAGWGEKGYIRLAYGSNQCNLVFSPSSSTV